MTTYAGGYGGSSVPVKPASGASVPACPRCSTTLFGPAVCQGCRVLVWWSGVAWVTDKGVHRCGA